MTVIKEVTSIDSTKDVVILNEDKFFRVNIDNAGDVAIVAEEIKQHLEGHHLRIHLFKTDDLRPVLVGVYHLVYVKIKVGDVI